MSQRPNILLCIADDAGKHQSAYGCTWLKTPAFDRIAREGLLFNHASTPNAKCAPSRAALLTGRNPWQLEEGCNHCNDWPQQFQSYMEALAQNGYRIGHTNKGWGPGEPGEVDGKPRELTGPAWNEHTLKPPTSCIKPNDYAANFDAFLDAADGDAPFCFWFGAKEPHRDYEFGSGERVGGKSIEDIDRVPGIWPDNKTVRQDLLDYGLELEYFDHHIGRMLASLEERGLLENTLIVVTSDNGMPFPRIKGQEYGMSNELPLAIRWGAGIEKPGRVIDDYVSFIDLAPTFLDAAGVDRADTGMQPITGKSLNNLFASSASGTVDPERHFALIGKERHDPGRPNNQGYPIRGIFSQGWLYLRNFEPDRWPACNPETGYMNCDKSPTKTEVLKARQDPATAHYWQLCFGKRPEHELYHVEEDIDCLENLADKPEHADRLNALKTLMEDELKAQNDPRMHGQPDYFESFKYSHPWLDDFYERFMNRHISGEKMEPGWINPTDIEQVDERGQSLAQ